MRTIMLGVGLVTVAVTVTGAPSAAAEPGAGGTVGTVSGYRYVVLARGEASAADVNDLGEVVGSVGAPYAVLWSAGRARMLGSLGGGSSAATGVNNRSQVVGWARTVAGRDHPFLWQRGVMRDLGFDGSATAINDRGVVVGVARPSRGSPYAFRWVNGRLTSLTHYGVRTGGTLQVTDVNDAGQIVGTDSAGPFRLTGTRLERPVKGLADARAVTDRGAVVGNATTGAKALLWTSGRALRTLASLEVTDPRGQPLSGSYLADVDGPGELAVGALPRYVDDGWQLTIDVAPFVLRHGVLSLLPVPGGWIGRARAVNDCGTVVGEAGGGDTVAWVPDHPTCRR
jgi:probable HAF family extracellular repeat protein